MIMMRRLTIWIASMTIGVLMMALVLANAAHAQGAAAPNPAGAWHGVLKAQGVELRIGVSITKAPDGSLSGSLTSPDQTPEPIPLAEVKLDGQTLSFTVPAVGASYEGTWDAAAHAWTGKLTQGLVLPLVLTQGPVEGAR